jgi:hypothetical protein
MDWDKVADVLEDEAKRLRLDAVGGFPNDFDTQKEMRTRASIFEVFGKALRYGLEP